MNDSPTPPQGTETSNMLMVVVGAHLRAEIGDRPLARRLKDEIGAWVQRCREGLTVPIQPVICCDVLYVNDAKLHSRPTISLGGPGVNALSAYLNDQLDAAWVDGEQMTIQLDPEFVDLRVCIWGANHELTVHALDLFLQKYLDGYLRAVATQVEPAED